MASEEEIMGLIVRSPGQVMQSASTIIIELLRIINAYKNRSRGRDGKGIVAKTGEIAGGAAKAAAAAGMTMVDGLGEKGLVSLSKVNEDHDAKSLYLAPDVIDENGDLSRLAKECRKRGIGVAAAKDPKNGFVSLYFKAHDMDMVNDILRSLAPDFGVEREDIDRGVGGIRAAGEKAYPDTFDYMGLSFKREDNPRGADGKGWVAIDPRDERREVRVWEPAPGHGGFEVTRNGKRELLPCASHASASMADVCAEDGERLEYLRADPRGSHYPPVECYLVPAPGEGLECAVFEARKSVDVINVPPEKKLAASADAAKMGKSIGRSGSGDVAAADRTAVSRKQKRDESAKSAAASKSRKSSAAPQKSKSRKPAVRRQ